MPRSDALLTEYKAATRYDGWNNAVSGLGGTKDKRRHTKFTANTYLDKYTWCAQYEGDGLVRRIIDTLPEDMTREGGSFENDTEDENGKPIILSELQRLDAWTHFREAEKYARLLGGALIFIGAMDGGGTDAPLRPDKIKNVEFMKVYDLGDILTSECEFNKDLGSPRYGQIERYKVRVRSGMEINEVWLHHTRCIPVYGSRLPASYQGYSTFEERVWGIPVMRYIYDDLRDYRGVMGSTAHILQEFVIGKYKFSDLDEMLSAGNEAALQTRMNAIEQTKSVINSVIIGTDEDYTRDSATVTGISDLIDRFMMGICSVSAYPVTKLFGRSASGLNATGEGDSKNYYDAVKSKQNELSPYIQALGVLIANWKNVDQNIQWVWNPLFQLTEKEVSDTRRVDAETTRTLADADQRYIDSGVLSPEEVYKLRFEATLGKKSPEDFEPMPDDSRMPQEGEEPIDEDKEVAEENAEEKSEEESDDKRDIPSNS